MSSKLSKALATVALMLAAWFATNFLNEEDVARLSPARYEHINPYGKYRFEVEEGLSRSRLRPLRQPAEQKTR